MSKDEEPITIEKPKEVPVNNATGTKDELRINTVDPASQGETVQQKSFLAWTTFRDEEGREYQQAVGLDGTVYKIVEDTPPPAPKQYKIVVESAEQPK